MTGVTPPATSLPLFLSLSSHPQGSGSIPGATPSQVGLHSWLSFGGQAPELLWPGAAACSRLFLPRTHELPGGPWLGHWTGPPPLLLPSRWVQVGPQETPGGQRSIYTCLCSATDQERALTLPTAGAPGLSCLGFPTLQWTVSGPPGRAREGLSVWSPHRSPWWPLLPPSIRE